MVQASTTGPTVPSPPSPPSAGANLVLGQQPSSNDDGRKLQDVATATATTSDPPPSPTLLFSPLPARHHAENDMNVPNHGGHSFSQVNSPTSSSDGNLLQLDAGLQSPRAGKKRDSDEMLDKASASALKNDNDDDEEEDGSVRSEETPTKKQKASRKDDAAPISVAANGPGNQAAANAQDNVEVSSNDPTAIATTDATDAGNDTATKAGKLIALTGPSQSPPSNKKPPKSTGSASSTRRRKSDGERIADWVYGKGKNVTYPGSSPSPAKSNKASSPLTWPAGGSVSSSGYTTPAKQSTGTRRTGSSVKSSTEKSQKRVSTSSSKKKPTPTPNEELEQKIMAAGDNLDLNVYINKNNYHEDEKEIQSECSVVYDSLVRHGAYKDKYQYVHAKMSKAQELAMRKELVKKNGGHFLKNTKLVSSHKSALRKRLEMKKLFTKYNIHDPGNHAGRIETLKESIFILCGDEVKIS